MSSANDLAGVRGVVLDVEGTTTPVSFVYDVLFPYARQRLRAFLRDHAEDSSVREAFRLLRLEWSGDEEAKKQIPRGACPRGSDSDRRARDDAGDAPDDMPLYLEWLMDRDRKSTGLKIIQGEIWRGGFESGALRGEVYPDVKPALERWHAAGRVVSIYSSGSATAQRLLFAHSTAGDLTPLIAHHFDTTVGPKRSSESYSAIARALNMPAAGLLFVSDVDAELVAARDAGMCTSLCVRSGDAPGTTSPVIRSFDEL
ncbi:MAG: acireductone synthase [Gemmatimonadaceae bacterium]